MRVFMLLLGAEDIEKLSKTNYLLKGELLQLYKQKFL
jgi:isopentenyl diphosphate isomerase/L-lactate dehydrogenase-like FMN-dependent dehydrogenase